MRKKLSEKRKQQLRDQLTAARSKKKTAEYKNVYPSVLSKPDDDPLSLKSIRNLLNITRIKHLHISPILVGEVHLLNNPLQIKLMPIVQKHIFGLWNTTLEQGIGFLISWVMMKKNVLNGNV